MQTALHITALVEQLRREFVPGQIVSTEFYRKQRAVYLFSRTDRKVVALGLVFHPAGHGCFCVPGSKVKVESGEKPWPVFGIKEAEAPAVRQIGLDRIIELDIVHDGVPKKLLIEALGPNANIWLLNPDGGRLAVLRDRQFAAGERYVPPTAPEMLDPFTVTEEQVAQLLESHGGGSTIALVRRAFYGFNETMARDALKRAGVDSPDQLDDNVAALTKAVREIAERFHNAETGYLYTIKGGVEAYPYKLSTIDEAPEKFKSLSLAVAELVARRQTTKEEGEEEKTILKAVGRAVKRLERLVQNVEKDLGQAVDYERFKRYGDLLQLNRDRLSKGMSEVEVEDIISATGEKVTVPLDAALSPNDNIEEYFRKHRKGREGLELLQRRLVISRSELQAARQMQAAFEHDLESARHQFENELADLLPREGERSASPVRLPYRAVRLSSGLTVLVGRDGADNDRTTFEFAKPYELWFHAQQCPGSHVVMKFPNKSFEPTRREIEETASLAAYHSKARNDSLVPVIYTERRFVRKPRKAKPGLVTVEREKSIMVPPRKEIGTVN